MANLNRVQLIGRLGADPETRYTADGTAFSNVRLVTSERYKDKSGEYKEASEWHRVVFIGKVGETVQNYATKGREVFVEGKLTTRKWTDKDGRDQYTTEIHVRDFSGFQLLGSKPGGNTQQAEQPRQGEQKGQAARGEQAPPPSFMGPDDEMPF